MGASSGLIVAFVVAVWAAYFVPLVLRRYDEAGKNAAVEAAGESGHVIASGRRENVEEETPATAPAPVKRTIDRPAARLAARRRRRTVLVLLTALLVTAGFAVGGLIPLWSIAVPASLVLASLVACRLQVRGELGLPTVSVPSVNRAKFSRSRGETSDQVEVDDYVAPKSIEDEDTVVLSGLIEDVDPGRPHVMESEDLTGTALQEQVVIAVPSVSLQGQPLWDPLPITVPTYVTKPRAGRTIRTIDFNQPGVWTSGHVEGEETELPQPREDSRSLDQRRAVGD